MLAGLDSEREVRKERAGTVGLRQIARGEDRHGRVVAPLLVLALRDCPIFGCAGLSGPQTYRCAATDRPWRGEGWTAYRLIGSKLKTASMLADLYS